MFILYKGRKIPLPSKCIEELEKVCIGLAKNVTGNYRQNHFNMWIAEDNGIIKTGVHGLGKVYRTNEISLFDILDSENRKKYAFYDALYKMIGYLNEIGIAPDELEIKYECGVIRLSKQLIMIEVKV